MFNIIVSNLSAKNHNFSDDYCKSAISRQYKKDKISESVMIASVIISVIGIFTISAISFFA